MHANALVFCSALDKTLVERAVKAGYDHMHANA